MITLKILVEDAANASAMTEANTPMKVCGLICPVSPLMGYPLGHAHIAGGLTYPVRVHLGLLYLFDIGQLVFDLGLISPTGWFCNPLLGGYITSFLSSTSWKDGPTDFCVMSTGVFPTGINNLSPAIRPYISL